MGRLALSIVVAAAIFGSVPTVSAVTYEPEPPFCQETVVHDYLAPLARLPKLHSFPRNGRIGFGPASLSLRPYGSLLVNGGTAGYSLFLRRGAPPAHPQWKVTTTLSQVSWKGRVVAILDRLSRHVNTVKRGHGAGAKFEIDDGPAFYRIIAVFRDQSGERLGSYGFYFRVVGPTEHALLGLNANSYRAGQTVFARVENFGTETALYGSEYSIEHLEGTTWTRAPESPRSFTLPLYSSWPGRSGTHCSSFWVPSTMPPGHYRMMKKVVLVSVGAPGPSLPTPLTAEFDVLP